MPSCWRRRGRARRAAGWTRRRSRPPRRSKRQSQVGGQRWGMLGAFTAVWLLAGIVSAPLQLREARLLPCCACDQCRPAAPPSPRPPARAGCAGAAVTAGGGPPGCLIKLSDKRFVTLSQWKGKW